MQASSSLPLEPGPERGAPRGRDLYTFVTSAAGHMMRTLQKPRRNRPSKRQVNHRRFLHNMIQRKFADIEAANRRLASTLYLKEAESTPEQSCDHLDGRNQKDAREVESGTKERHKSSTCPADETIFLKDDSEDTAPISPSLMPPLSPLSFDAAQMFVDIPGDPRNLADIAESDWEDIMDLFSVDDGAIHHTGHFSESDDIDSGCGVRGDGGPIVTDLPKDEDYAMPEPVPVQSSCQHRMMSTGGVAQSFWAPPLEASLGHFATPPHEDQLTFTDILIDSESPECAAFNTVYYHGVYTP
ncbi:uncharacterized protein c16h19orf85 [Hippocampus comes]|uniref:uncharacterized protein c16h19orf85 n=1 Tax=Hippocampus comes TaxID=109280 RepID=UPI00094E3731|nr:PREDICTED: uncharacterized protein LOC109515296 [Hippocampus comes]